ncbi:MAG TPA: Uma2 family endonuclease [Thermoanaerobaculia bacterium]|jgi:Uma2 family endonuclease|nr:Uma2 family endonuclease [Thermoanaerobaculia bacterium]
MAILPKNEERLITGEEIARWRDFHGELVNGRPVPMPMAGRSHAKYQVRMSAKLHAYAEEAGRGLVLGGEAGLYTRRNPDTVRGADALFISHERYARCGPLTFLDVAPELVVEISSDDRPGEVAEKVEEYLSIGVDRVWVVSLRRKTVQIHRSGAQSETLEIGDTLRDEDILPGFSLSLSDLFQD